MLLSSLILSDQVIQYQRKVVKPVSEVEKEQSEHMRYFDFTGPTHPVLLSPLSYSQTYYDSYPVMDSCQSYQSYQSYSFPIQEEVCLFDSMETSDALNSIQPLDKSETYSPTLYNHFTHEQYLDSNLYQFQDMPDQLPPTQTIIPVLQIDDTIQLQASTSACLMNPTLFTLRSLSPLKRSKSLSKHQLSPPSTSMVTERSKSMSSNETGDKSSKLSTSHTSLYPQQLEPLQTSSSLSSSYTYIIDLIRMISSI